MVKGRGMLKGRGNEKGKGDGEGKGDGKEKGDGEGKGLPGPSSPFVGGPGPSSLSSRVSRSCCHWAVLPHRHRMCHHRVVIGPCRLIVVVACLVMSLLCLVLLVTSLCCPGCVIVWCRRPCLAALSVRHHPVSEKGELGGTGNGGYSPWSPNKDDEHHRRSSFGCHVAVSNVAPGSGVREMDGGRRAVSPQLIVACAGCHRVIRIHLWVFFIIWGCCC